MEDPVRVMGRVTPGRGLATTQLGSDAGKLPSLLGRAMCPGTLNLFLDTPLRFSEKSAIKSADDQFLFWPASVNDVDVWVFRWPEAPLHIAELVSEKHLRSHFNLNDGDRVQVNLEKEHICQASLLDFLVWSYYWRGRRRNWFYTHDGYARWVMGRARRLGGAQVQSEDRAVLNVSMEAIKFVIRSTPILGKLAKSLKVRLSSPHRQPYMFERTDSAAGRPFEQVMNLLNYTKTSNSSYSAQEFPAAYHTIRVGDQEVRGQRNPELRFRQIPIDFAGKTVLDIGCNQGGMLFANRDAVKWGVGIDYDPRMINAANRIRVATGASSLAFYVFDLEKEPLELIGDFLPEAMVDVCFLLSVCMWIKNWRDVIDFAQSVSHQMIFETNGSAQQQADQLAHLRSRYRTVNVLSETSEDDPSQKNRALIHLLDSIGNSNAESSGPGRAPVDSVNKKRPS
jgi:SAM-dependent methyltransferase